MTWLIEHTPYWICASCMEPAQYKPGEDCSEQKHRRAWEKKKALMRVYRKRG